MPLSAFSNPMPAQCLSLLGKLSDADADIRYMSLNDLCGLLTIIDGIILTLDDQNGEVQNQAIKCVGALVLKLPPDILAPFVHRVSNIKTTNSVDTSIPTTALRKFITAFPPPLPGLPPSERTNDAYSSISKVLIPRLLGYLIFPTGQSDLPPPPPAMLEIGSEKGVNTDALDVLIEVIRCFGPMLKDAEKQALQKTVILILDDERTGSVVKKKAVIAISLLCVHMQDSLLRSFVGQLVDGFQTSGLTPSKRRLLLSMVGSISRAEPQRVGAFAKSLVPFILSPLSQEELEEATAKLEDGEPNIEADEVREAALLALEGFLACCSNAMRPFTHESIDAAIRYVSYDPNSAADDGDDMEDTQEDNEDAADADDEDFEQEEAFSDDEDASWKIRRCAAKALFAIISTRSNGDLLDDGTLYDKVAPVLVQRFKEREENVRLEVLVALGHLVRKTGDGASLTILPMLNGDTLMNGRSRKRRRVDSITNNLESAGAFATTLGLSSPAQSPSPVIGPRAELARLSPAIVKGVSQLLRQTSTLTKQAAISVLRDIVLVQSGGLSESLPKIMEPLLELLKSPANSTTAAASSLAGLSAGTEGNLRIDALQLLAAICDTHSSIILAPYVDNMISNTIAAAQDRYYKVSGEALLTLESIIKAITPPRSAGTDQQRKSFLCTIYDIAYVKAIASDADLEVRRKAIRTLGVLLARTSGSSNTKLLAAEKRSTALGILQDRLKNETTRIAAVTAIDIVAVSAQDKNDLQPAWAQQVALELGGQLRKADRTLRTASLAPLRALINNPVTLDELDKKTILALSKLLLPLMSTNDLSIFGVALGIYIKLVRVIPKELVRAELTKAMCEATLSPLSGNAFSSFLGLVQCIGEQGVGKSLMQGFLQDVGVSGDPIVVGKAIGTLLVAGGDSVAVGISDFESELRSSKDPQRQCLALSVIGEAGFRMGSSFPLKPQTFTGHFNSKSDVVRRAAATALGRAGAGNTKTYLPVILSYSEKDHQSQYLSLYSIKEILQNAGSTQSDISHYSKQIWDHLHSASQVEDNEILGAECIGRLTAIEPTSFLSKLQAYLKDQSPIVRSMAIQAVRFTFTDSEDAFDEVLRPALVNMLSLMLADPATDNRRLALGTLNAAIQHKSDIVLPQLGNLVPLVLKDSKIDPDLIREVQMGPFKHKVDDGLDLRKSAYETLFSLMENAYSRMNHADLYERVIAGLDDEHEIKMLCTLMLTKLINLDYEETLRRLDSMAEKFRVILNFKPKENSVKQEVEKATEASKAVLTVTVRLHHAFPAASAATSVQSQSWKGYWEWLGKEHKDYLMRTETEVKSQAA